MKTADAGMPELRRRAKKNPQKNENPASHPRVKQGVSLNYTSLDWPQAGEALTLSRIQMWWSQGRGPSAPADPQVVRRQTGPASSRCGRLSVSMTALRPLPLKAEPQHCKKKKKTIVPR